MNKNIHFEQEFGAPPPPPPPPSSPSTFTTDKASSRAIWALILGIASWTICPIVIPAIIAWIMGKKEINEIEAGRSSASGLTMAKVGMWLGLINTILNILALFIFIIVLIIGLISSSR
jgi:hypothetical protein